MVYIYDLLSAGIAFSKTEKNDQFTKYGPTTRILKYWQAKMKYQKRMTIAQKIADKTHSSKKEVIKSTMPYIQIMMKNDWNAARISRDFGLDDEEVAWLSH